MNCDRQSRKRMFYNNLHNQYLNYMKKVSDKKKKNTFLKNTNKELSKKLIQLRLEVRKSSAKNANLKAEIYDVAVERKNILENSKKIFDHLASFRNDIVDIDKKLCDVLGSSKSCGSRYNSLTNFSMPIVNGQLIQNPRVNAMKPENHYQRYNFKDCIYIQDLSPIMEENAEVKKLVKPPDITRRLGHRAKVPQPFTSTANFETNVKTLQEGAEGTNLPWSSLAVQSEIENFRSENQSCAIEVDIASTSIGPMQVSSSAVNSDPNDTSVVETMNESIMSNGPDSEEIKVKSLMKTVNITQSSDSKKKDFSPSIFVNVFPRRKKVNDSDCRLSVEEITVDDDREDSDSQELNSTSIEKAESSLKPSFSHSKGSVDLSINETQTISTSVDNSSVNVENIAITDSGSTDKSLQQSMINRSWSDSQENVETTSSDTRRRSKRKSGTSANSGIDVSPSKKTPQSSLQGMKRNDKSYMKKSIADDAIDKSPKNIIESQKKSSKSFKEGKVEVGSVSQRCSGRNSSQSPKGHSSNQRSSSSLFAKEESKKVLRPKKALNLTESPLIIDKKRVKKKKKNQSILC